MRDMELVDMKDQAVDAVLRSYDYLVYRMIEVEDDIKKVSYLQEQTVCSPAVKSPEDAFYGSQHYGGDSKHARLAVKKYHLETALRFLQYTVKTITEQLKDLSDEDLQLLYEKYEQGRSAREMAEERFISKDTMLRRLARIREGIEL